MQITATAYWERRKPLVAGAMGCADRVFRCNQSPGRIVFAVVMLLVGACGNCAAAAQVAPPPPPSTPAEVFHERIATIESDLANLLQRRTDASGPALAIIDYQIDLRIVERWMLAGAGGDVAQAGASNDAAPSSGTDKGAAGKPQAEPASGATTQPAGPDATESLQASIALRVVSLQSAGDQVANKLENYAKSMTQTQTQGLKDLHDLTYTLKEGADAASVDDVCRKVTASLILISNPDPVEIRNLPIMRPHPVAESTPAPAASTAWRPPTIAELTQRIDSLDVSPGLKKQLLSLAAVADRDSKAGPIGANVYEMLSACTDLAEGVSHNTAIDAAARPRIELQLTESLALFTDIRTRKAGLSRIASLAPYRQFLGQMQRMHMPAALQQKLSPTFTWANSNPESGGRVLAAIEKYVQLCAQYDARKAISLAPAQKSAVDNLQRQFAAQRIKFLDEAIALGATTPTPATSAPTPAGVVAHVESMRQYLDAIAVIEPSSHAVAVLTPYRPRPTGTLEKRVAAAVANISSSGFVTTRDADAKFLADLVRLAQLSESIVAPVGLPPDVVKNYAHGRLASVESHRTTLISNLASELASGKDLDIADLLKLDTLRQLYDSLHMAGDIEAALAKSSSIANWADWSVSPDQLKALVSPFRDATAAAFDGFADDNLTPISRWPAIQKRFVPLLLLVKEIGQYADQCKTFPTGLPGDFAKLLTPMDKQPFATERYASMAIGVWQRASEGTDQKVADGLFDAMLVHLRKDFKIME